MVRGAVLHTGDDFKGMLVPKLHVFAICGARLASISTGVPSVDNKIKPRPIPGHGITSRQGVI